MATTQLVLYNIALYAVGERNVASTDEDREPKRLLDEIWTRGANGAVGYALEQGQWLFASRTQALTASTSVTPSFGFSFAFGKPTDMTRLTNISTSADFGTDLFYYRFESTSIYSNSSLIWVEYTSNSTVYGNNLSLWPETFTMWMGHWLATQMAPRLKNDLDLEDLTRRTNQLLISARLKDAAQKVAPWPPVAFDDPDHRQLDYALELITLRTPKKEQD